MIKDTSCWLVRILVLKAFNNKRKNALFTETRGLLPEGLGLHQHRCFVNRDNETAYYISHGLAAW